MAENNRHGGARAGAEVAVQLPAGSMSYLAALGTQMIGLGLFAEAIRFFQLLVTAEAGNGFYNRCLGICCEQLDRLSEAAAALDRAIAADPADEFALLTRAGVRLRCGDRAGALLDVTAAASAIRDPASANAKKAQLLLKRLASG